MTFLFGAGCGGQAWAQMLQACSSQLASTPGASERWCRVNRSTLCPRLPASEFRQSCLLPAFVPQLGESHSVLYYFLNIYIYILLPFNSYCPGKNLCILNLSAKPLELLFSVLALCLSGKHIPSYNHSFLSYDLLLVSGSHVWIYFPVAPFLLLHLLITILLVTKPPETAEYHR